MLIKKLAISIFIVLLLSACASTPERGLGDEDADKNAATIYQEAKNALDKGDYETAIGRLESLEARFPFGKFAQQAQLDMAYAYYKFEEPESAISSADRFIKLYPRHPHVDYAYYLRGVIKFDQGHSMFDTLASQDPATRDSGSARQAFQFFSELLERYPNSKYAQDSVHRMIYLRNNIARSELMSAKYNMKMGAYVAAVNRSKYIIKNLHQTPSVPEALAIMVKAYEQLQLNDLSRDAKRVLESSYPNHEQTLALNNTGLFGKTK